MTQVTLTIDKDALHETRIALQERLVQLRAERERAKDPTILTIIERQLARVEHAKYAIASAQGVAA